MCSKDENTRYSKVHSLDMDSIEYAASSLGLNMDSIKLAVKMKTRGDIRLSRKDQIRPCTRTRQHCNIISVFKDGLEQVIGSNQEMW